MSRSHRCVLYNLEDSNAKGCYGFVQKVQLKGCVWPQGFCHKYVVSVLFPCLLWVLCGFQVTKDKGQKRVSSPRNKAKSLRLK